MQTNRYTPAAGNVNQKAGSPSSLKSESKSCIPVASVAVWWSNPTKSNATVPPRLTGTVKGEKNWSVTWTLTLPGGGSPDEEPLAAPATAAG